MIGGRGVEEMPSGPKPWETARGAAEFPLADWFLRALILIGICGIFYYIFAVRVYQPLLHSAEKHHWAGFLVRPSILWALMGVLMLCFRTLLWFSYRPKPAADMRTAPAMTVIIPAYNEGAMVAKTIASVAAAKYPRDRLEIVVIDDGSKDDTWEHIEGAVARCADRVTTVRFPQNRGKRAALEEGFHRARGEVVVTIDSDSEIDSDTLLAIAGPFRDPKVGAVAGKVLVHNRRSGVIPRMLHVRFILSFDFLRSAQSTYGTVYCCPGALSAYRTSVVREVLPFWREQKFLGVECTYGEDRALTNFILGEGYDSVYQGTARVRTLVPENYGKLCRMYLRWDRSYIREEIRFARIVWKRPPVKALIAALDVTITNLRYPVGYATMALLAVFAVDDPTTILRVLSAMGIMTSLNMLYYLRSELSWDFLFGIFYAYFSFFTLFWIFPYALLTVRSRSWLTR